MSMIAVPHWFWLGDASVLKFTFLFWKPHCGTFHIHCNLLSFCLYSTTLIMPLYHVFFFFYHIKEAKQMEAAVDTLLVWAHVEVPLTMQPFAGGKVILVPGLVVYFADTGAFFSMKGTVDASNDNVLLMSSWTTILCKIIIMWIAFRLHISPRCLLKNVLQITYPGWCFFFFLISSTPNAAVRACVLCIWYWALEIILIWKSSSDFSVDVQD